jgi:hypothetical protein
MLTKACTAFYHIVIEYTQGAKVNAGRIVVAGKAKRMIGIQPAVVGMAAGMGFMQNGFYWFYELR